MRTGNLPVFLLLLIVLWSTAAPARAQSSNAPIQIDVQGGVPLAEALAQVRAQAGVDLVFTRALVEGRRSRCRYAGEEPGAALACLLRGTGLEAQRVRRRQYVIVRAVGASTSGSGSGDQSDEAEPARAALAGFVTDAATGETLPGANVALPSLELGAATNSAGYFSLPDLPRRRYRVHVSYLGYRALDTTLAVGKNSGPAQVALRPQALEAEAVVVRSPEEAAAAAQAPGGTMLPAEALSALPSFFGEGDLVQALDWLPGLRKSAEAGGGLSVRGGQTDQNLYLLDGAPVYHPWHAFSLLSTFQTGTLKSTQLYRSAFPAEYGGRLSSVLSAQMKDGRRKGGPEATLGLSPLSGRFLVESPLGESVSLMVSGRRSYLDLLVGKRHPVEEAGRRDTLRTGYFFYDLSAKLSAHLSEKHRVSLSYYHGRDNLDLRLPFDLSLDFSSWLRPADLFFEIGQNWENQLVSARHQYLVSDRIFLTTTAYYSGYQAREDAFVRPSASASVTSDYRVRLRDFGLKLDADYYLAPTHQVRAGLQVTHRRFDSRLATDIERAADTGSRQNERARQRAFETAAYVQDTWQPTPRWTIRPGLRASFFSSGPHVRLSPRLSASYRAHPRLLTLRAAAGRDVQYLHRLRDRYSLLYDLVASRWVPASEDVRPSQSTHVSFDAVSHPAAGLRLRVGAYLRRARRVLVPEDVYRVKDQLEGAGLEAGALLGQYVPAETRSYGLEVAARYRRGPWRTRLSFTGARSRVEARLLGRGRTVRPGRYDVPRTLQAVAGYDDGTRWNASLAAELRSGAPHTVPVARYQLEGPLDEEPTSYLYRPEIGNGRLPAYFRLDATLGRRFGWLGARWHAQFHLYNATGRRNVIGRRYELSDEDDAVHTDDRRGLPILPLFEMEVEL